MIVMEACRAELAELRSVARDQPPPLQQRVPPAAGMASSRRSSGDQDQRPSLDRGQIVRPGPSRWSSHPTVLRASGGWCSLTAVLAARHRQVWASRRCRQARSERQRHCSLRPCLQGAAVRMRPGMPSRAVLLQSPSCRHARCSQPRCRQPGCPPRQSQPPCPDQRTGCSPICRHKKSHPCRWLLQSRDHIKRSRDGRLQQRRMHGGD
jgi:hypothetical protein